MTVIATDGRVMASDTLTVSDDLVVSRTSVKVAANEAGDLIGLAGEAGSCDLVREWFAKGEDLDEVPSFPTSPNPDRESRFKGLILRRDGRVWLLDACFTPVLIDAPAAIGSGGDIALGAMIAGASPKRAVQIAMRCVSSCGGTARVTKPTKRKP